MHGRRLSLEHDLRPLRYTLEYGGLWLADACCGNEAFDKSFRKFAQELFPKDKLTRVPPVPVLRRGKRGRRSDERDRRHEGDHEVSHHSPFSGTYTPFRSTMLTVLVFRRRRGFTSM